MHPYFGNGEVLAFAHRGGSLEGAENTLEAFEHAIACGFRYLESDVQATSDGVLVLFHDDTTERLTGAQGTIAERTWDEVRQLKVLGTGTIPRFDEVLSSWPDVNLNLDAKTPEAVDPLCRAMEAQNLFERICLASFSKRSIDALRDRLGSALCTSACMSEAMTFCIGAKWQLPVRPIRANCLQLPTRALFMDAASPRILGKAQEFGLPVHFWTIDDPAEINRLLDLGADGIMTDKPSVLAEVMRDRGLWA